MENYKEFTFQYPPVSVGINHLRQTKFNRLSGLAISSAPISHLGVVKNKCDRVGLPEWQYLIYAECSAGQIPFG